MAGEPIPDAPHAAQVRPGLNFRLIEGTPKPRDAGSLLA